MNSLNTYGFLGILRLMRDTVFTRLFYPQARLIRTPVYIRGRRFIHLGKGLTTGVNLRLDAFSDSTFVTSKILTIGDRVEINDYVHIAAVQKVEIGNDVLIASKVFITDHNHGSYNGENQSTPDEIPGKRRIISKPVIIEDNVWLGEYVVIMPGVTIGRGSVIGALSVVTKDIPSNSIAVGSPARVIKKYNDREGIWERT
ncbi:MAG: DapH/DapD/GlmU-related protein [Bacteroidota bacterium]